jgi:hypothetical protein
MSALPKDVSEFMAKFNVASDELWEVRPKTYAIKHKALERVAAEQKIQFDPPLMLEFHASDKIAVLCVTGKMGERVEWSIGEAAPYNNKNTYPFAMAEKRAKDRVTLKLLQAHGALYSEAEADEFKENGSPNGKQMATLPKKDARDIYTKMQNEIRECQSRDQLKAWGEANKDRIKVLPEDWQDILRLQFEEMLADLRQREAA